MTEWQNGVCVGGERENAKVVVVFFRQPSWLCSLSPPDSFFPSFSLFGLFVHLLLPFPPVYLARSHALVFPIRGYRKDTLIKINFH